MANEKRLIDILPLMTNGWTLIQTGVSNCVLQTKSLADVPTVDAVEVVHGWWIKTNKYDEDSSVQCSKCLMEFDYIDGVCYLVTASELPHYCPNCGAKMEA